MKSKIFKRAISLFLAVLIATSVMSLGTELALASSNKITLTSSEGSITLKKTGKYTGEVTKCTTGNSVLYSESYIGPNTLDKCKYYYISEKYNYIYFSTKKSILKGGNKVHTVPTYRGKINSSDFNNIKSIKNLKGYDIYGGWVVLDYGSELVFKYSNYSQRLSDESISKIVDQNKTLIATNKNTHRVLTTEGKYITINKGEKVRIIRINNARTKALVRYGDDKYIVPVNRKAALKPKIITKANVATQQVETFWISLNYLDYYGPTISKPEPPTVTLNTAQDIALGGLITVSWNTPADAKYFSAILKDSNGNQVERYDNIYGNSTSFQPKNAGKYTVEVIAQNSEYSSDPGKLGQTITVHDLVKVIFVDEDGTTELGSQKIPWGDNAVALFAPEKLGHNFRGWSGSLTNVKSDTTVQAQYDKAKYTVQFIGYQNDEDDSNIEDNRIPSKEILLKSETVAYGEDATPPGEDELIVPKNYEFLGWSSEKYKEVYSPYKNEPIKIYAVYGWKNKDLPVACELVKAERKRTGYYVYYNLENNPDAETRGRVVVALKTAEGKLVDMTESSAFSLEKGETENNLRIFLPCEKAATTAEIFVVNGYTNNGMSDGIPISEKKSATIIEGKMWSDWTTDVILQTDDNEVESRKEYRFLNVDTAEGHTKRYPDWVTLMSDGVYYKGSEYEARLQDGKSGTYSYLNNGSVKRTESASNWSDWSYNKYDAFDTESKRRKVETKDVNVYSSRTKYNYYHWHSYSYNRNNSYQYNSTYEYHYIILDYPLSYKSTGSTGIYWYGTYSCPACGHSDYWIPNGTTSESYVSGTRKQYRYQDTTYNYFFYRWDDDKWSNWSADEITQTNSRQVEERTVYREKSIAAGIEDVTGEMRTFSGRVDPEFAGKNITFFVSKYNAISDFTDEYVAQGVIGEDGSYTFDYKLREEPTAETGDYSIMIGIEGTTEKQIVGTIEAPKPVYTVKFYSDVMENNPEVIFEAKVRQGEVSDLPDENPSVPGYKFICWNNSCTNVQSDMDVYPVFEQETYKVVFVDHRKGIVKMEDYTYGQGLKPPTTEVEITDENGDVIMYNTEVSDVDSGYGIGWDYEPGTIVTSDMIVTAQYETKTYDVTFHDYDGSVIDTQTVEYDGVAEAPELADDENDGVEYYDWEIEAEELYGVKENIDVFPSYDFDETTPTPTASVETGAYDGTQTVTLNCDDENAVIYYTTDGESPKDSFDAIEYSEPIVIDSKTELNFYASSMGKNDSEIVTEYYVINNDGVIITLHDNVFGEDETDTYFIASMADFDESLLEVEGYTLNGVYYDNEYTQPVEFNDSNTTKGSVAVFADYSVNTYSVTFKLDDGTIIDSQTVNYSESAVAPDVDDKGTLKFVGWDSDEWECVTKNLTVRPVFKDESEIISVSFDKSKYQMELDSTYQINATITAPDEYEDINDAVVWYSDNESVATVDNTGLVTSVSAGNAKISANTADGINTAVCEITVAKSVNNSIILNKLSALGIDSEGYLRRIPLDGTNTVDSIANNFLNEKDLLTFKNAKGNEITGGSLVGTNTIISLQNGDNTIDSLTVVMTGDITCDGVINNRDVSYSARVIVKRNTADAGQLRAMDVNGDGKVNNRDVAMLSRYLVGKEQISN